MKKTIIKILAVALVAVMMCAVLVSCGKTVSGTYKGEVDAFGVAGAEVVYKFSGKKVAITATANVFGFEKTVESDGTYEITENEDGSLAITFTFESEDAKSYGGTVSFEKTEEGIKLGGVEYKKQ